MTTWQDTKVGPVRGETVAALAPQRGFVVIALAIIGLLGAAAISVPVLNRATTGLRAHSAADIGEPNGARSAAEHGIWRIRTDSAFVGLVFATHSWYVVC